MKTVELTAAQKAMIVKYFLSGSVKGFLEDMEEFWEGIDQEEIDNNDRAYRRAVSDFMDECQEQLLSLI